MALLEIISKYSVPIREMRWLVLCIVGCMYEQNSIVKKMSVWMIGPPEGR